MKSAAITAALAASLCGVAVATPAMAERSRASEGSEEQAQMEAAAKVVQASLNDWRSGNYAGWIARYHPKAVVVTAGYELRNRAEIDKVYRPLFDAGLPDPEIVESGWTGESVYVVQNEYLPDGTFVATTYAEYTVSDGQIVSVFGRMAG